MTDRFPSCRTIRLEKAALRKSMAGPQWESKSQMICERLLKTPMYRQAETLFAFMSVSNEPDTDRLIRQALADGKSVAVPKCISGRGMKFYEIDSPDDTIPGRYGIPEPASCDDSRLRVIDERTLILVPGLVFDLSGNRLGYGAGYYDRYLADDPYRNKLMIAFSFQQTDEIRNLDHDIPVDWIITEDKTITVNHDA